MQIIKRKNNQYAMIAPIFPDGMLQFSVPLDDFSEWRKDSYEECKMLMFGGVYGSVWMRKPYENSNNVLFSYQQEQNVQFTIAAGSHFCVLSDCHMGFCSVICRTTNQNMFFQSDTSKKEYNQIQGFLSQLNMLF